METEEVNIKFGKRLKGIRQDKGYTQEHLAEISGISRRMVAHYESHAKKLDIDKIIKLALALNISVDELLGLSKPERKPHEDASYKIMKKVRVIEKLPVRDQNAIFRLISSLADKNNLEE
ncbi:MAG: helix-turn-helix transcriptional regulator [bacterium]|nr:helix-turn-helix transcriptional regulator [bacterium]